MSSLESPVSTEAAPASPMSLRPSEIAMLTKSMVTPPHKAARAAPRPEPAVSSDMGSVSSSTGVTTISHEALAAMSVTELQQAFFNFCKARRTDRGQPYTHNAQVAPKGVFAVGPASTADFYMYYCALIAAGGHTGMMEKNVPDMPLLCDVDFDFVVDRDDHTGLLYEPWVVTDIVSAYQEAVRLCVGECDERALTAAVLEKTTGYYKKGDYHNGFHVHFPFATMLDHEQQAAIAPSARRLLEERGTLERMQYKDRKDEGWARILDPDLPKKTWIMYGARKDNHSEAYLLTALYDSKLQRRTVTESFDPAELSYVRKGQLPLSFFTRSPAVPPEYFLPVYLSIHAWSHYRVTLKPEIQTILPAPTPKRRPPVAPPAAPLLDSDGNALSSEDVLDQRKAMDEVRELAAMLSAKRADAYDTWMHTGWCFYTITKGSADGLALWRDFSKKSAKYEDGICEEQWERMTAGNWSIGSLKYWAKMDSPDAYATWRRGSERSLMYKALSLTHYDVAAWVHKFLDGRYVCASLRFSTWYEFRNHRWNVSDKGVAIYSQLSTEAVRRLDRLRTELSQEIENTTDEELRDTQNKRIAKIGKLSEKLKDTTYKNKLMSELSVLFYEPGFMEKLDNNPELIVCTNGVLDLRLRALRPGVPEDFCSKSTHIAFPTHYTEEHSDVRDVRDYLRKCFPSAGLYKYFCRFAASTLRGGNANKILPQFFGVGDNSKSVNTAFFVHAYGDYCIKFPTTFFTCKSASSGAATPEVERSQGARIGFIQEPNGNEKLNIGKAKEFTGGDSVYTRGLYKEGRDIKMMMKFVIVCNQPLSIPSNERAIWGRLRLVPFLAMFSMDPSIVPATEEEQYAKHIFHADPLFPDRVPALAPAFLWIMWHEFDDYIKHGLEEPEEVRTATEDYRRDTDTYSHFMKEKVVKSPGNKLGVAKLFKCFTAWFKVTFPSIIIPSRIEMRDSLNRLFRKPLTTEVWLDIDVAPDEEEGCNVAQVL